MLRRRRNGSESQEEFEGGLGPTINNETVVISSGGGGGLSVDNDSCKDNDEPNNGTTGDDDNDKKQVTSSSSSSWPRPSLFQQQPRFKNSRCRLLLVQLARTTIILLHVAACLFYAAGFYLAQTRLYTHEECDMTYSRRQFVQLQLNEKSRNLPLLSTSYRDDKKQQRTMTTTDDDSNNYRLFKFFDQRDPRHADFLQVPEEQALGGNAWCNTVDRVHKNGTAAARVVVVVYVPGHAGSFQQSRSIGAHGLGLTSRIHGTKEQKIIQALRQNNSGGGGGGGEGNFMYDVYALDFREQGSGLHGALLQEQARFLTRCIHHLITSCNFSSSSSSIYIVAHSMGGIVARLAMTRHSDIMQQNNVLHSIITLGTPHAHPIMAWDSSIHSIYQELQSSSMARNITGKDVLLISISGGLRDEMIPPTSCIVNDKHRHDDDMTVVVTSGADNNNVGLTLLGPQHMIAGTVEARGVSPSLGMDHRAIVWCHNILSTVRSILYILAKTEYQQLEQEEYQPYLTPRERLDRVKTQLGISDKRNNTNDDYFLASVQDMRRTLWKRFGRIVALAMETGLVYNLELLVGLFTALAAWYTALEKTIQWRRTMMMTTEATVLHGCLMMTVVPSIVILHCWYNSDWLSIISLPSIVVLTLLANAIFWTLYFTIRRIEKAFGTGNRIQGSSSPSSLGIRMPVLAFATLTTALILCVVLNAVRHYDNKIDGDGQSRSVVFARAIRVDPQTLLVLSSKLFLGAAALLAAFTACRQIRLTEVENSHINHNNNSNSSSTSRSRIAFSVLILLTHWSQLEVAHYLPALLPIFFMRAAARTGIVVDQKRVSTLPTISWVVWVLALLPVFSAGEFYLIAVSNANAQLGAWTIPLTARLIFAHGTKTTATAGSITQQRQKIRDMTETAFQVVRVFIILRWSKVIFKMGVGSHPVFGHHHSSLLSAFSSVDILNELARLVL